MKSYISQRIQPTCNPTIWQKVVSLVQETKGVNLSQGAPQFGPQPFFVSNMKKASQDVIFEQTDIKGIPQLHKSIAKYHERQYGKLNEDKNIVITSGAGAGLFCLFAAFIDPQDQIILFQPAFDYYRHFATIFKAKTQNVKLWTKDQKTRQDVKQMLKNNKIDAKNFQIDWQALEKKISQKTKMIIINSPHNPSGKIFTQDEIDRILQMCIKYPNLVIIQDNVYEGFMYDEFKGKYLPKGIHSKHYPLLQQRILNVYSAGKLLEATGIRCGWILGQQHIITLLKSIHKNVQDSVPLIVQKGTSYCLDDIVNQNYYYFDLQVARAQHHRLQLLKTLANNKYDFRIAIPKSGYFILVDISNVQIKQKYFQFRLQQGKTKNPRDLAFCYQLAFQDGVIIVPCSSFFSQQNKQQNWIRFALCKNLDAIRTAGQKLHQ